MRSRRLLTAVLTALTVPSVLLSSTPVAQASSGTVFVSARAAANSTVGAPVQVAVKTFPPGTRLVTATVTAKHAAKSAKRPMMLSADLSCGDETAMATTNVLTKATLTARRIMQDARSCKVTARSAATVAKAKDGLAVNAQVRSEPVSWNAVGHEPGGWPDMVLAGDKMNVVPVTMTVPDGSDVIKVLGDAKLTTCTSVGGSRENGSPYMCIPARLDKRGSVVSMSVVIQQLNSDGTVCTQRTVPGKRVHIDRKTHHAMVAQQTSYRLSATCPREVTVKLQVNAISGADVIIHRKGTATNVFGS